MTAPGNPLTPRRRILRLSLFFASVYFVQGIAEPGAGLASQPLFFLLKDTLRLSAAQAATFLAVVAVAWNIKPVYGLVSDLFPLFGYRRKSYLMLTTGMAALTWFLLGSRETYLYAPTLLLLILCGLGLAFSDVLCDAVMVETGKPLGMTGRFQSVQWGAINLASVLAGIGGGWLSAHASYQRVFRLVAVFPLLSLCATALCVDETPSRYTRGAWRDTTRAIGAALWSPPLWVAAGFIFLWNFSPSFGVPLEYHFVDALGFSKVFLGTLSSLGSAGAIVGAAVFGRLCRGLALKPLLNLSVGLGVIANLAYLLLAGPWSAALLAVATGGISMVAALATYDLAARSCPERAEGTFFAALMSIANLGTAGSAFVGGRLYDWLGLQPLILVSAAATAGCWLIVPYIRATAPESAETDTAAVS
jgi:MFS family permease